MRRLLITALCLPSMVACANNAILEVTLDLPPAADSRGFAYVQARSESGTTLLEPWSSASSIAGTRLRTGARERITFEVEARAAQVEAPLLLKVRFCDTSHCDARADLSQEPVEQHYEIERAFYRGAYTSWGAEITVMPSPCDPVEGACHHPVVVVGKCEVFGCIAGSSSRGCPEGSTVHYCEM